MTALILSIAAGTYLHLFQVRKISWRNLVLPLNPSIDLSQIVHKFFLLIVFAKN